MNDIMYLDRNAVLQIVYEVTRFTAAIFIPAVSTKKVISDFPDVLTEKYTALPHKIIFDQGTDFGRMFKTLRALKVVKM